MAPVCGIIPEYVLQGIIQNGLASQHVITRCRYTLDRTRKLQNTRRQHIQSITTAQQSQISQAAGREHQLHRTVYDAQFSRAIRPLRDKVLLQEGDELLSEIEDPTNNANECYISLKKIYDFYFDFFQRNSIDNNGIELNGFVHARDLYNAFWSGYEIIFGDGDGVIFNGFTDKLDVIGHEFSHGVVEYSSLLPYEFQSGALNESIADAFGVMIKQWGEVTPQTVDEASWLIGEGLWAAGINGRALRDMKNPGTAYDDNKVGKDPQPAHWRDFQELPFSKDNGGVHINSGIPNRAFYLAATMIGGYSWKGAGPIWYRALTSGRLRTDGKAKFKDFADLTIENAGEHEDKIRKAWTLVGYPFPEERGVEGRLEQGTPRTSIQEHSGQATASQGGAEQATPRTSIQEHSGQATATQGGAEQATPRTSTQGHSGQATATQGGAEQATPRMPTYSGLQDLRQKLGINSRDLRNRAQEKHAGRAHFKRWYPDGSLYSAVQKKWRMQRDLYKFFFVLFFSLSVFQIVLSVAITVLGPLGHRSAVTILGGFNIGLATVISLLKGFEWPEIFKINEYELWTVKSYIEEKERHAICKGNLDKEEVCKIEAECYERFKAAEIKVKNYRAASYAEQFTKKDEEEIHQHGTAGTAGAETCGTGGLGLQNVPPATGEGPTMTTESLQKNSA